MANRWKNTLSDTDVTPEHLYLNRRHVIGAAMAGLALSGLSTPARAETLEPTSWEDITSYNNFYEFGTGKDDPKKHAHMLTTDPWSVKIDGMVERIITGAVD
ncbi:MAG: mononuclear molybdenum enzyme YedY, partial [Pseudomonadota bacterium]